MNPQHNLILEVLSKINDDIIARNSKKRYELLTKKRVKRNTWMPWVAAAACLVIVVGALLTILPMLNNPTLPPVVTTPPDDNKQVPIYQGMTVSNQAPTQGQDTAWRFGTGSMALMITPLTHGNINQANPFDKADDQQDGIEQAVGNIFPAVSPANTQYFAKKNEDIYIHVHISNPDNFEILSFTLNGVKYSSYMFEHGSDMETLILKYNVGDVEGTQSYTIDAIKYVDGENIKDVRMDGERTVQVHIYPENQPVASTSHFVYDQNSLTLIPTLVDELGLIVQSSGELYAVLYDGETIVAQKKFTLGDTVVFDSLAPATLYQCAIVGIYDAIDGQGKAPHILYKEAFLTSVVVSFENVVVSGLTATFDLVGGENIVALGLYEGDTLYRELRVDDREVQRLPIDKEVSLVATYGTGNATHSISYTLPIIKESEGLLIVNGVIRGFGSCTDTVLYLNHPIAESAFCIAFFPPQNIITEVYCGEGVTSIGKYAFQNNSYMAKAVLPAQLEVLNEGTFFDCQGLASITFPDNLKTIAKMCFSYSNMHTMTIPSTVTRLEAQSLMDANILNLIIPKSVTYIGDMALNSISFIYYEGSQEEWKAINKGTENENAKIYYNCDLDNLPIKPLPPSVTCICHIDGIHEKENGYRVRGWTGFNQEVISYGYYIQDENNIILDESFSIIGADHEAIVATGGKYGLRFDVTADLTGYSAGTYPVSIVAKLKDGSIVTVFAFDAEWAGD